ncbi:MAG: hypothetical protein Q9176_005644 [Flavoplaca citrina]
MPSEETNKSIASHSPCSSCCSAVSETSTLVYDHETWVDFVPHVHELCRQLWPSASEDEEFIVEKLRGGSYNRIIGIKTPPSTGEAHGSYVLRIPRYEFAQQAREMAIMRYVRQHTSIPTADIIFYDSTSENPIKEPYVVHSRIPGQSLQDLYPTLNHRQKRAVAKQWGQLLLSQRSLQNSSPGVVRANIDEDGKTVFAIFPYDVNGKPDPAAIGPSPAQSVLEMFATQFERQEASHLRSSRDPETEHRPDHCQRLTAMARDMDAAGYFKNNFYTLCHLDLYPRNVMLDIQPDGAAIITGVLDWDSAVFAPDFVVCAPPSWIWAWTDDDDETDDELEIMPTTPEDQQLKQDFEGVVGNELHELFYAPQYRMGRRLFDFAIEGIRSTTAYEEYKELMKEWAEFQSKATNPPPEVDLDLIDLSNVEDIDAGGEARPRATSTPCDINSDLVGLHVSSTKKIDANPVD